MSTVSTKGILRCLGVGMLVLGLAGPALGQGAPPPAGPIEDLQATLGIILDRLDDLEGKVDNLPGALGPCDVPPVWGKTYPLDQRFIPVFGGAAFCDKATGLVWDGSPDPDPQPSWYSAHRHCYLRTVGDVNGFHLPTVEQMTSLLPHTPTDLNSATGEGPFSNVMDGRYWSAVTGPNNLHGFGVSVKFNTGEAGAFTPKSNSTDHAWCVRGGQSYDGQDVRPVIEEIRDTHPD